MAKCKRCGRRGLFLRVDAASHCSECAAIVAKLERDERDRQAVASLKQSIATEKEAEAERKRKEELAAKNIELERLKRNRYEAERLAELKRPFEAPDFNEGFCLAYSYTDVGIFVPDECREIASAVPPRKQLYMRYEPDNPYDPDAIEILYDGQRVGYMYKGKLRDMVDDFAQDKNKEFLAVSRYWTDNPAIDLFFYRSAESTIMAMSRHPGSKEYTLTSNKSLDVQDFISMCQVGEDVTIEIDPDTERYIATVDGGFIGRFPLSATKLFEQHRLFDSRISEIEEDEDTGKYSVRVIVKPGDERDRAAQ